MTLDIHALSGAYAVDALEHEEREQFEEHLAGCAECQAEVAGLQSTAAEVAALAETPPPARLREAVLRDIARVRPLPPPVPTVQESAEAAEPVPAELAEASDLPVATELEQRRRERGDGRRRPWLAVAAAAAVIVIGGTVWHPWNPDTTQTQTSVADQVLQAGDAQRYVKHVDGATATLVRSQSVGRSVIVAKGMAAPPAGHVYELWYFDPSGAPVRAGLMPRSGGDSITVVLHGDAAKATGAGITVEPAGGSDLPTTKPVVAFSFA